ncbi:hypothetical protein FRB99_009022 [Tulasnella sp. 403]|nr:hypothetical protein FRB99_009022 [Tulasnella sp. 403]
MKFLVGLVVTLSALVSSASAHGFVSFLIINGFTFSGFLPDYDLWQKPHPHKITRHIPNDGPVQDMSSKDMICNAGAGDAARRTTSHAGVAPGQQITFRWGRWPDDHKGPVTTYMASCGGSECTNFDGTGKVWFKIDEMGLVSGTTDTGTWASDILIKIPDGLKPGPYVIRHEILALHSAKAPQFYPSCSQLQVSGTGTKVPDSSELVAIPGDVYKSDQSTMIDIWKNGQTKYPIAGPPVTKLAAASSDPINAKGGMGPRNYKAGKILSGTEKPTGSATTNNATPSTSAPSQESKKCRARKSKQGGKGKAKSNKRAKKHHVETRKRRLSSAH